jgi:hypothetical protein
LWLVRIFFYKEYAECSIISISYKYDRLSGTKSSLVMAPVTIAILLILVLGSPPGNVSAKKSSDDGVNNPDRCFQAGKDDGRDSQFSQSEFDTCGSSYEHGFMKGCLSVDGNTRDICNNAEDSG